MLKGGNNVANISRITTLRSQSNYCLFTSLRGSPFALFYCFLAIYDKI